MPVGGALNCLAAVPVWGALNYLATVTERRALNCLATVAVKSPESWTRSALALARGLPVSDTVSFSAG